MIEVKITYCYMIGFIEDEEFYTLKDQMIKRLKELE